MHKATASVLAANGLDVHIPKGQTCCGALHGHQGKLEGAKELAKSLITQFESTDYDALILNSAGCGSFHMGKIVPKYGKLDSHLDRKH